jgi:hypothetical protein
MDNIVAVETFAEVRQVKTMADLSLNVTLNFGEDCKDQAKKFIDWQGKLVKLVAIVVEEND